MRVTQRIRFFEKNPQRIDQARHFLTQRGFCVLSTGEGLVTEQRVDRLMVDELLHIRRSLRQISRQS